MAYGIERSDVVVVGAGPAGAVVTQALVKRGFSVTCLEQGDWSSPGDYPGERPEFELLKRRQWSHDPNVRRGPADYPLDVAGSDMSPIMWNGVGGGSLVFGGYWHRLLPSDFRVRSLDDVADDWPLTYEDLAPFYDEVSTVVGVSGLDGDPTFPADLSYSQPPLPLGRVGVRAAEAANALGWHWWPGSMAIPSHRQGLLEPCARMGVCEWGCPHGAKSSFDLTYWSVAVREGARLVSGARVCEITTTSRGLADGVVWIDRAGRHRRVQADAVVVCANGIGTPRLLLMSTSARHPNGLGNSSGMVGRHLMLHPNVNVVGHYEDDLESWKGPAGQAVYSMQFYETDTSRSVPRGFKLHAFPVPGPLAALDRHRGRSSYADTWGEAFHRSVSQHAGAFAWGACVEDLPEAHNRVELSSDLTDGDGLPAARITYRLSQDTRSHLSFAADRMRDLHAAGGAVQTFEEVVDAGHLMGTARMGDDPDASVVDRFGRSHDVPNLFVADGSVFVTSGAINPTATITALALRTAHHLADSASDGGVRA